MTLRRAGKILAVGVPSSFVGCAALWRWQHRVNLPPHELMDLRGRNIVMTGATSGIGRALAETLATRGANVIVGSRDAAKGQSLCSQLRLVSGGGNVEAFLVDLGDPGSVANFVAEVKESVASTGGVHALVSAAAEIKCELERSSISGVDMTFAINHLGPQQLVSSLAPEIRRAASSERAARVVLLGSRLERRGALNLEVLQNQGVPDPRMLESFDPMGNYASSKLANMLLCKELHARFEGTNVDVFIVSPGMVHTDLWRNFPAWYRILTYPVRATFLRSTREAAAGVLYALAARELEGMGGKYMSDGKVIESSEAAQNQEQASALFAVCSHLIETAKVRYLAKRMGLDLPLASI